MTLQRHRCLRLLVLLLVLAGSARVLLAAPNLADYPLRVRIYNNHWNGSIYNGYRGFGRANLIDGADAHAMDYTFDCDDHFMANDGGEAYPAKWKKPGQEVEMLVGIIGSDKVHRCTMKVSLKDFVFSKDNGELHTLTLAEYHEREANRAARKAALTPADADIAHYPLKLSILNLTWNGTVGGISSGMGQGNLETSSGLSSVDFTLSCPVKIDVNPEGRYYRAQWTAEGSSMTLLLRKLGDPAAAATCDLKTIVHSDIYIRNGPGDLKAVTQEQYKHMQQAETTTAPAPTANQ